RKIGSDGRQADLRRPHLGKDVERGAVRRSAGADEGPKDAAGGILADDFAGRELTGPNPVAGHLVHVAPAVVQPCIIRQVCNNTNAMTSAFQPRDRDRFETALRRFDEENSRDPNTVLVGGLARPRELVYAEWLTDWVL